MWRLLSSWLCLFAFCCVPSAFALTNITITADQLSHEDAILDQAHITLDLTGRQMAVVDAKTLKYGSMRLDNAHILLDLNADTTLLVKADYIESDKFEARNPTIFLDYRKAIVQPFLAMHAEIRPLDDDEWADFNLNCLIPPNKQKDTWHCVDGKVSSKRLKIPFSIDFILKDQGLMADIQLNDARFSDESGLYAGEKLTGRVKLAAHLIGKKWHWSGLVNWESGEVFWQPFYFNEAGNEFLIEGTYLTPVLDIKQAQLKLTGIGTLSANADINIQTKTINHIKVDGKDMDFTGLYQTLLKPMATNTVFGHLEVSGKADWRFEALGMQPKNFELNIENAQIEDLNGKFDFDNLNAHIPWDYEKPKTIFLAYSGGHLLNMPIGMTHLRAQVHRYSIMTPQLRLPILDGALVFEDISAAWLGMNGMVWHLQMKLEPVTMNEFSKALGWPEIKGKIDGQVPLITYANKQLNMDGKMQFNMFNGLVTMSDLQINDPLGVAPTLYANLKMRDIDLGDLTRTFNFGSIEGKLEGDVKDLRLQNWKPVHMDAIIQTADGEHIKKVSQRAVENITALGGEGTAAALQRTFLRFFKEFNYEKIGLSCQLRNDMCKMGGVESTPTGFVIVKGRGIPSVNVNGYTQYVSLKDLIARIQRITDSNTKVVVD